MEYLSNGDHGESNGDHSLVPQIQTPYTVLNAVDEEPGIGAYDIRRLLRKYWLLFAAMLIVGCAVGFASVVLSSPMYKAHLLLEVQNANSAMPKDAAFAASPAATEEDIQTQVNILHSATFLKRGAERLQSDSVPLGAHWARYLFEIAAAHSSRHAGSGGSGPDGVVLRNEHI